ncbi:MAG: VWA domain-containing protein [Candidatus Methylomirabilia bacterium]
MTRIALVAGSAGLLLFAALAARLRPRVGPAAGLLQAALLALFLSLAGAFLAVRSTDAPAAAARSLIVLADADAARRDPDGVRNELARLPKGARTRLALFELRAAGPLNRSAAPPGGLQPEARFSSLDAALGWAALEAGGDSLPEVILIGDPAGTVAVPEGLALTRVPLPERVRRDRIGALRLAPRVFPGRPVTLRAAVRLPAGSWTLRLLVDDKPLDTRSGRGSAEESGDIVFTFPAGSIGAHRVLLELAGEDGAVIDRAYGECAVHPFPRLAYLAPEGPASPLERLLAASGYPLARAGLEELAAGKLPAAADLIILEDVPAAKLPWPAISALSRAVAWEGRGLLFVGGPHSFTAGGYRDAPVERLLPLTMGIRDPKQEKHHTALVIVLDTSASMSCPPEGCPGDAERMWGPRREKRGPRVKKIDLARQALLELLPAMKQVDHFGILGIRMAPYWELEPGSLEEQKAVEERIRRIEARDGGINLYSALLEASKGVAALDADIKHILVLLDTDDIDEIRILGVGSVEDLVTELARQRISVSFVGFGFSDDRYVPLLHQLASSSGGALYLSSDVTSIPRFLREDREGLAGRQAILKHLETRHDEAALPGLARTPPVEGIFVTEAKGDASTVVWAEIGYPLVALRRIERGTVGAFAGDGGREMAPGWAAPAARETWDAVLAALLPRDPAARELFLAREGAGAAIWWRSAAGGFPPLAAVADPAGKSTPAVLREVFPGSWRGDVALLRPGSHQVSVTPVGGRGAQTLSFAVPPPSDRSRREPPDLGRFTPPAGRTPIDGRIPQLLLLLAAASFTAYELVREHD